MGMDTNRIHVGVDATSWINDRGFGRFTRELMTALAKRDEGFRYTLVFDRPHEFEVPANVDVIIADTRETLNVLQSVTNPDLSAI